MYQLLGVQRLISSNLFYERLRLLDHNFRLLYLVLYLAVKPSLQTTFRQLYRLQVTYNVSSNTCDVYWTLSVYSTFIRSLKVKEDFRQPLLRQTTFVKRVISLKILYTFVFFINRPVLEVHHVILFIYTVLFQNTGLGAMHACTDTKTRKRTDSLTSDLDHLTVIIILTHTHARAHARTYACSIQRLNVKVLSPRYKYIFQTTIFACHLYLHLNELL